MEVISVPLLTTLYPNPEPLSHPLPRLSQDTRTDGLMEVARHHHTSASLYSHTLIPFT